MAVIAPPMANLNLTEGVLSELTSKLSKEPEIKELELSDGASSTHEEFSTAAEITILPVDEYDYVPVRSEVHRESVELRQELSLHLSSVMHTGDEMLVKIRLIVEKLDTAVNERHLALAQLGNVTKEHHSLKRRFVIIEEECTKLKQRLVRIAKDRDDAEIKLVAVEGELLEKRKECINLKAECDRLNIQITDMSEKLVFYTSRLCKVESEARSYLAELERVKIELGVEKKKVTELERAGDVLRKELNNVRIENKEFKLSLERITNQLRTTENRLNETVVKLSELKLDYERCVAERGQAERERTIAVEACEVAERQMKQAFHDRDDALRSRTEAIYAEKAMREKWIIDSNLLAEREASLKSIQLTISELTKQHKTAVLDAANWEHLRDHALEQFHQADARQHLLTHELVKAEEAQRLAEELTDRARAEVLAIQKKCDLMILEKEQLELDLAKLGRDKNAIMAELLNLQHEYIEADRQRDIANEKFKVIEDSLQKSQHDLTEVRGQLALSQAAEKAAKFELQVATESLAKSQASEQALTLDVKNLSEALKIAEAAAYESKKEFKAQVDKLNKEKNNISNELKATKTNETSLLAGNKKLLEEQSRLSGQIKEKDKAIQKQDGIIHEKDDIIHQKDDVIQDQDKALQEKDKTIKKLKDKFGPPTDEHEKVLIRHIFFGGIRITNPAVYSAVMESRKDLKHHIHFTVDKAFYDPGNVKTFEVTDANAAVQAKGKRVLAVYYAVCKNGVFVDRPAWTCYEGSSNNHFAPAL